MPLSNRLHTITQKIKTDYGSMYIHMDMNGAGQPMGALISTPHKEPESQITRLIEVITEGLNDLCQSITVDDDS